ncbi:MAG: hypothetical protein WKG00_02930 [Polyangiaceae bacterium]
MSPEQARGLRDIDARSDLWSLSVIAYRALTGRQPFVGQGVGDVIYRICSEPIVAPSALAPELPPAIDAFFERALAREPAQRFQSAIELAAAFAVAAAEPLRPPASVPSLAPDLRAEPPFEAGSPSDPSASTPAPGSLGTPSGLRAHGAQLLTPMPPSAVTFAPAGEGARAAPATRRLLAAAIGAFTAIVALGVVGLRLRDAPVVPRHRRPSKQRRRRRPPPRRRPRCSRRRPPPRLSSDPDHRGRRQRQRAWRGGTGVARGCLRRRATAGPVGQEEDGLGLLRPRPPRPAALAGYTRAP